MKAMYLVVLPAVLALGLVVAACGQKKDATPAASTTTTSVPAKAATKAAPATSTAAAPDFAIADADTNGGVSLPEAQKIWPTLTLDQFATFDINKDGSLSAAEYAALAKNPPAK